jgi:hypothetical protein
MLSAVLLAAAYPATAPVELYRQWKPNTTLAYQVKSHLFVESRHYMTSIFIPEDLDQNYNFTLQVGAVTGEGFANVTYKRPKMEIIYGETAERGSLTEVEDVNQHYVMSMSPVNAITDLKDLTSKKKEGDGGQLLFRVRTDGTLAPQSQDILQRFIGELYRLALFIGNAETAVDFGPRLPLLEVEPGDTWNVTASYQPQKLSGKEGKMATQRLDYTYKYDGQVEVDGKKLERITATLAFDNDIAPFINEAIGMKPAQSGLRGLKMKLDAKMEFDLDPVTKNTLAIRADSTGAFSVEITQIPDRPVQENKLRGRTRLKLLSIK